MQARMLVVAGLLAFPGLVHAQVCIGNAPLGDRSAANVAGGAGFFDGGTSYGASFNVGSEAFLSAGFGFTDFDDTELSLKSAGVGAGYQVPVGTSNVTVCPSAGVSYGFGLEILGVDLTTWTVTPALAVGMQAELSPSIDVIPYAQVGMLYQRLTADGGPLGEETVTETDGFVSLGLSLLFNDVFTVGPSVSIPFASDNGDTVVGVGVSVAFGGPF